MPTIDYIIYILGIYGLSWIVVHSTIFSPIRNAITKTKLNFFIDLINCIVCTSVWLSTFFVYFFFNNEAWFTQMLIVGSTTTTTWLFANLLNDLE